MLQYSAADARLGSIGLDSRLKGHLKSKPPAFFAFLELRVDLCSAFNLGISRKLRHPVGHFDHLLQVGIQRRYTEEGWSSLWRSDPVPRPNAPSGALHPRTDWDRSRRLEAMIEFSSRFILNWGVGKNEIIRVRFTANHLKVMAMNRYAANQCYAGDGNPMFT